MVQLDYKNYTEQADIAGLTVAEAREKFREELGLHPRSSAILNGIRVSSHRESATVLHDDDNLVFRKMHNKVPYLLGALLLALALTGGAFASGFVSNTTTIGASTTDSNYAEVTANTSSSPSWTTHGYYTSNTGNGTLFDVDTLSSGYTGDLVTTITLANTADLGNVYRYMTLMLEVRDSSGALVDINGDSTVDSHDVIALTLNNAAVDLVITQSAPDVYTVWLKNGSFKTQPHGGSFTDGNASPQLFCEVAHR